VSDEEAENPDEGAEPEESEEAKGQVVEVEVEELDEEALERRRAALAEVHQWGDPVLRSAASPVREFSSELAAEAERMIGLMRDALGVGLAATQLGALRRLLVYQAGPEAEPRALVNPSVEWASEETEVAEEGCLSLLGVSVDVERPAQVRVKAQELDGSEVEIEAEGLEARVIQHEVDHLNGILILDRTVSEQRRGAVAALREGSTFEPADLLPEEPEAASEEDSSLEPASERVPAE